MSWISNICLLAVLVCTLSVSADENILPVDGGHKWVYDFQKKDSAAEWNKTQQIKVVADDEGLQLNGNGWDAKIYRTIKLPAGYYLITACGKGKHLQVQMAEDFNVSSVVFDLNLGGSSGGDDWRTDWRPFRLKKSMNLLLMVRASAGEPATSFIKYIRIEQAREIEESGIPTVAELKKQCPQPALVRGCTCLGQAGFPELRSWGANVVRKWIILKPERFNEDGLAEYGKSLEKQLEPLIPYLQAAREEKMKVVLTLSGGVFANTEKVWSNPEMATLMSRVWQDIAKKLLPYRDVIWGYDLYNEPLDWSQMPNPPRQWRNIAKAAIKAIREVDKETWIVYETGPGGLSWGYAGMKPLPDTRIIYSVHFYSPHEFTHQGIMNIKNTDLAEVKAKVNVRYPGVVNGLLWNKEQIKKDLEPARQFQLKYHVPILVGEFSVVRWAPKADAVQYLTDLIDIFEEYHWSWVYHAYRECTAWSVEHDETFGRVEDSPPYAKEETGRAKVLKAGLLKNLQSSSTDKTSEERKSLRSQLELVSKLDTFKPDENEFRIYFIGDSITRHGFGKDTIERLKWDHLAGMAASSEDKDYAHLVADSVGQATGKKIKMFFGRGGDAVNALGGMEDAKQYRPNLVIVQLGEHVPSKAFGFNYDDSREKIVSDYAALLDALKKLPSSPLILCTGIWDPQQNWAPGTKKYFGRVAQIEEVQSEVCRNKSIPFVSVEKYALDPSCSGSGGSPGVKWHPNDAGHAGYAGEIVDAFKRVYSSPK